MISRFASRPPREIRAKIFHSFLFLGKNMKKTFRIFAFAAMIAATMTAVSCKNAATGGDNPESVRQVTVTFNLQGKGKNFTQKIDKGDKATEPEEDPVVDGYDFGGWFADKNCAPPPSISTSR